MRKNLLIHPDELSRRWIDRMVSLGVQVLTLHPEGGTTAHESLVRLLNLLETPEYRALLDYAAERGLEIEYAFHAASYLLPRELFESHPTYFRMDENGERTPKFNFCASNEETLGIVAKRAVELAGKLYRTAPRFHFWLDDGRSARCCCEKCRTKSASDLQLHVMNTVLRALRENDVSAKLAFLAYFETLASPQTVKPEAGIFIEYAPFDRDMKAPAEMMSGEDKAVISDLLSFFGLEGAQVLEYWYDNSMFSGWKKPPKPLFVNNDNIRADLNFYGKLGFSEISSFACFLGADYEALYGEPDLSVFGE